ncbi:MAG TPA: hypothetical protein VF681_11910 [Abditibacteriaceae bacterium]|jgi:hypothetical protein
MRFCKLAVLGLSTLTFFSASVLHAQTEATTETPRLQPAKAVVFEPRGFQEKDGAIPLIAAGETVDPYFATKALLTAHESGLDIRKSAEAWIKWLLPRQKKDGRFERFTRQKTAPGKPTVWKATAIADADDALMALWVELLYAMSPDSGLPEKWKRSVWMAGDHLATLQDKRGYYLIAQDNRVGLLMDNIEIYNALNSLARERTRMGQTKEAAATTARAAKLGEVIRQVFWNAKEGRFRVSTQTIPPREEFYPHSVAQIFPLLANMPSPLGPDKQVFDRWLTRYGYDWLWMKRDDYPWGLVALLALRHGEMGVAQSWRNQHQALRFGEFWPVLDEAVYQVINAKIPLDAPLPSPDSRLMP